MEKTDRSERDDTQKAKLIFISLAALVAVLLIWSIASAARARSERDAARQELEMIRSDNIRLEQMLKDVNLENDTLKKKVVQLEARAKAKPAAAKKKTSTKNAKKKTSRSKSKTR